VGEEKKKGQKWKIIKEKKSWVFGDFQFFIWHVKIQIMQA
jgi:hypothetical protein